MTRRGIDRLFKDGLGNDELGPPAEACRGCGQLRAGTARFAAAHRASCRHIELYSLFIRLFKASHADWDADAKDHIADIVLLVLGDRFDSRRSDDRPAAAPDGQRGPDVSGSGGPRGLVVDTVVRACAEYLRARAADYRSAIHHNDPYARHIAADLAGAADMLADGVWRQHLVSDPRASVLAPNQGAPT